MSTFESQDSFFDSFLDDYFAECDEHLMAMRRILLEIEAHLNQADSAPAEIDRTQYETLLRSLHSIKGLSGMVNVQPAEQLAHQIESYVRQLGQQRSALTLKNIDLLIASTRRLEQIIRCHHTGAVEPEIESLVLRLAEGVEEAGQVGEAGEQEQRQEEKQEQERVWCFEFMPTVALAERGVDVNQVRDRLNQLGSIIQAEPQMTETGSVVFHFRVATRATEATFAPWQQDGLVYRPFVPAEEETPGEEDAEMQGHRASSAPSTLVRVDLAKLDELMRLVGELVISRARLEEQVSRLAEQVPMAQLRGLQDVNGTLEQQIRQLREGVMRVRLVPIGEMFTRMQFVVRDLVKESQKQIRLQVEGQETEIDKLIVERMMDPLLHLVRNAVSHGMESPEERVAQGKTPQGTITLRAATAGEMVVIEVEDDGRGIEGDRIIARAQALGLLKSNELLDKALVLDVLCASGFSTREQVDRVSGRGVGMAVVKTAVSELGGLLTLDTHPGRGARFTIQLPLTLAIADALIVSVGERTFAIPQAALQAVIAVPQADITRLENDEILSYRGSILPLLHLSRLFGLSSQTPPTTHVLVMGSGWHQAGIGQIGIGVDRVLGQREIVVQPLTDPLVKVPGIAGATELGDRQTVLILDVAALVRTASQRQHPTNRQHAAPLLVSQPGGSP